MFVLGAKDASLPDDDQLSDEYSAYIIGEKPKELVGNNGTLEHHDELNLIAVAAKTENQKCCETCYTEFPIHTLVLSTNSDYFQKLFTESGMKENLQQTVTMKVKHGEGIYLERMIQAFYDPAVLTHQHCSDLISLMDIGGQFLCVTFLEHCMSVLETKEIESIEDFDSIFVKLSRLNLSEASVNERLQDFISECTKKLTEKLYPLELDICKHEKFMELDFVTIKHLITSDYATTITEDHLLLFLYKWLQCKDERQTTENIQVLLKNIKLSRLSVLFVCNEIAVNDPTLNKWEVYPLWFSKLMKWQLLTSEAKRLGRGSQQVEAKRQKPSEDLNYPFICDFFYTGECFESTNQFVWRGVSVVPQISVANNENNKWYVQLKFKGEKIFLSENEPKSTYRNFVVVYSLLLNTNEYKALNEGTYDYYRRKKLELGRDLKYELGSIALVDETFLMELKTLGVTLVLYIQGATCSLVGNSLNQVRTSELLLTENFMKI